jgi:hypothetical protein
MESSAVICEAHRAEAIQKAPEEGWIASLRSQ